MALWSSTCHMLHDIKGFTITNIHKDSVVLTWQCQQGVMRAMRDVETACQMRSARCSQGVTDQANTF